MILNQWLIIISKVRFSTEGITVHVKMTFAVISRITLVNFHLESMTSISILPSFLSWFLTAIIQFTQCSEFHECDWLHAERDKDLTMKYCAYLNVAKWKETKQTNCWPGEQVNSPYPASETSAIMSLYITIKYMHKIWLSDYITKLLPEACTRNILASKSW
jgi:hypothetical protein